MGVDREVPIHRSGRAVFRELAPGEGGVLLRVDTGAYHGLNTLGCLIWSLLAGSPTLERLVAEVRQRVEDTPPSLEREVAGFLSDLQIRDLIRIGGDGTNSSTR